MAVGGASPFDPSAPGAIKLWDAQTARERGALAGQAAAVAALELSRDGKVLASGGASWRRGSCSPGEPAVDRHRNSGRMSGSTW